ncbi:hypothetical protein CF15_05700 [Pyrodictium occultum]|uniref:DUF2283 domain-containing protein n=1 Tax=Pyrodictium occultum TaxID=2309 RepID=A0A0V8RW13_PYROC|nr:DUF2283 domain-containing protein [Pyrodictium occultum]KSW12246.1 hypothetical protein CF15_05700 [Pyrodictium occultum]
MELEEPRKRRYCIEDIERVWIEYDRQSDILYIHFGDIDEEAEEAILTENDIVFRVKSGKLLTMSIMDFSRKAGLE